MKSAGSSVFAAAMTIAGLAGGCRVTAPTSSTRPPTAAAAPMDVDGTLSAADSAPAASGGADRRGQMAQRMTAIYFQDDDDPNTALLTLDELASSIVAYDTNRDGVVDRSEFESIALQRRVDTPGSENPMMRRVLDSVDGYALILEAVDENGDGALGRAEMIAFFHARDDGDGVWTLRDPFGGGPAEDAEPETGRATKRRRG